MMLNLDLNETERDYQVAEDEDYWQGCGEAAVRLLEQIPVLVKELREARAKLCHVQAERDTLLALVPLYRAVDRLLFHPLSESYPKGYYNRDRLTALWETFRGMSVDTEEAAND